MKKFRSETFKHTISGKYGVGMDPHIKVCVNPHIWEKYKLTPKTSPADYADMLLPMKKKYRVKNKLCPFHKFAQWKI